jgi:hypothetical protein
MAPVALMMSRFALGRAAHAVDRALGCGPKYAARLEFTISVAAGLPEVQRDRQAGHDDRGTALLRF